MKKNIDVSAKLKILYIASVNKIYRLRRFKIRSSIHQSKRMKQSL